MSAKPDTDKVRDMPPAAPNELLVPAYYEAGHADVAVHIGIGISSVELTDEGEGSRPNYCPPDKQEKQVLFLLAGRLAEAQYLGQYSEQGWEGDYLKAFAWARVISASAAEATAYLDRLKEECKNLIATLWPQIRHVVEELHRRGNRGRLTGREVKELMRVAPIEPGPEPVPSIRPLKSRSQRKSKR